MKKFSTKWPEEKWQKPGANSNELEQFHRVWKDEYDFIQFLEDFTRSLVLGWPSKQPSFGWSLLVP